MGFLLQSGRSWSRFLRVGDYNSERRYRPTNPASSSSTSRSTIARFRQGIIGVSDPSGVRSAATGCSAHPAFPAPSVFWGQSFLHSPGVSRRGIERAHLFGCLKIAPFQNVQPWQAVEKMISLISSDFWRDEMAD